ncbi:MULTISPECIES: hypothetical protein [Pelosinus]|uniref:Uncharacterized protein n=1 Tax=Pelosinus fermentans B4 TaxID=1149862 RepID=I8RET7_9FIRM|nr:MULTISPECIES: hypothetical protein [Pelosinus]EIW17923.1 hypothetical protein FB4_3966 [Pelosinus fermentans B4]EIW23885.1 hypothetical protein FA11_3968 [Pelosinus fermentans A11]OAM94808.1 hypothetical protein FR7_02828 [Pelosinus fermentans DSM 17108]SDR18077.1 hypothetical protein SAMN04515679_2955 [Pelosinus fermentans]
MKKEINEMDSSIPESEIVTENQDSADTEMNTNTQAKNNHGGFVISNNQMPS